MTSAAELFRNRAKARVGSTVRDKWRLDALLGIGGTAAVYAATHRNGKRVAVKILRSELASYEEVTTRFAREGYVANKIEHPGVVSVLDDDITEDGAPFLVMELLEGHSLDRYTKGPSTALPLERVMMITDRVLDVLHAAHHKSVIHRDIKPANIFLCRGDDVKVLDFGIARITDALDAGMTQTGTAIGTPGYMAPEQARGRWSEVDGRTDLWAVGATMYGLLIGQRPRRADTVQEELLAAMTQPMEPIANVIAGLPPAVAQFIDKSVAFDRNDRFDDAQQMLTALRELKVQLYAAPPQPLPEAVRAKLNATVPMTDASNEVTTAAPFPSSPSQPSGPGSQSQSLPLPFAQPQATPSFSPHAPDPHGSQPQVDFVDEATVASAPSWQLRHDEQGGATAYPFTLPSQPVAIPVPTPPSRSRGVWLLVSTMLLASVLGVVLFLKRPTSAAQPMPTAEPPAAQQPPAVTPATPAPAPDPQASQLAAPPPVPADPPPRAADPAVEHGKKNKPPPGPAVPPKPKPDDKPKEDPRCKNPETAPPSCFR